MQKLLLSTALAGSLLDFTAHAQNSVTLYGIADGGYLAEEKKLTVDSGRRQFLGYVDHNGQLIAPSGESIRNGVGSRVAAATVASLVYLNGLAYGPSEHYSITNRNIGFKSGLALNSRWGLKGQEDLGNGLQGVFILEGGFDLGNGRSIQGGRLFGREAWVGLRGSWGTLELGRNANAAHNLMGAIDPMGTNYSWASITSTFGDMANTRSDNMIRFKSAEFGGLAFIVGGFVDHHDHKETGLRSTLTADQYLNGMPVVSDEYTGNPSTYHVPYKNEYRLNSSTYGMTFGFRYDVNPIRLMGTYDLLWVRNKEAGFNGLTNVTHRRSMERAHMWILGGYYDFDYFKLHLAYGQAIDGIWGLRGRKSGELEDALFNPLNQANFVNGIDPLGKGFRLQAWMAGFTAPMGGQGTLSFSYQGNTQNNQRDVANVNPDRHARASGHIFSLTYTHQISKRTSLYGLAAYGTSTERTHDQWGTRYSARRNMFALGMSHKF